MSASPLIDQLAADVRTRHAAKPPKARVEIRRTARRAAAEIRRDLPDLTDEQVGAVLLRISVFADNLAQAQPGASARGVAGLLAVAGEHLYHHPSEAEPECGG